MACKETPGLYLIIPSLEILSILKAEWHGNWLAIVRHCNVSIQPGSLERESIRAHWRSSTRGKKTRTQTETETETDRGTGREMDMT